MEGAVAEAWRGVKMGAGMEATVATATRGRALAHSVAMRTAGGETAVGRPPGNAGAV